MQSFLFGSWQVLTAITAGTPNFDTSAQVFGSDE